MAGPAIQRQLARWQEIQRSGVPLSPQVPPSVLSSCPDRGCPWGGSVELTTAFLTGAPGLSKFGALF